MTGGPAPPVHVLGVARSGTTLLRLMLAQHSALAIPSESHFVPQLAARHGDHPVVPRFLDDVRRLAAVRYWGLSVAEIAARIPSQPVLGEAIGAIFRTYAARVDKPRWGDKTPSHMAHLPLIERLWPDARFIHIIRDGRACAASYLAMPDHLKGIERLYRRTAADVACAWRTEIRAARGLGNRVGADRYLELHYEALVADSEAELRRVCSFLGLPFERAMLEHHRYPDDAARYPHHRRLAEPASPTEPARRLSAAGVAAFEHVAGDLLDELGYQPVDLTLASGPARGARLRLARYQGSVAAHRVAAQLAWRSPLWTRRHPRLI